MKMNHNPVNVASVLQRSLFRYPGGKTWFVPTFRRWIASQPVKPHYATMKELVIGRNLAWLDELPVVHEAVAWYRVEAEKP